MTNELATRLFWVARVLCGNADLAQRLAGAALAKGGAPAPVQPLTAFRELRRLVREANLANPLAALDGGVESLAPSQREPLALMAIGELGLDDVAAVIGAPVEEVRGRILVAAHRVAGVAPDAACDASRTDWLARGAEEQPAKHMVDCDACADFAFRIGAWVRSARAAEAPLRLAPSHTALEPAPAAADVPPSPVEAPAFAPNAHPGTDSEGGAEEGTPLVASDAVVPPTSAAPQAPASDGSVAPRPLVRSGRWRRVGAGALIVAALGGALVLGAQYMHSRPVAAQVGDVLFRAQGDGWQVLELQSEAPVSLKEGQPLPAAGYRLRTDARSRASIDGPVAKVSLDRASAARRDARGGWVIDEGVWLWEGKSVNGITEASTPNGALHLHGGARVLVTVAGARTHAEVLSGYVDALAQGVATRVEVGHEALLEEGRVDVVASRLRRSGLTAEGLVPADERAEVRGLGELRARKPGATEEKERGVRLVRHDVKVRIAGNMARTEVEEEFLNDSDEVLEGIYRFPLPAGAQIERLALDVEGKLVDGEFVDQRRGAAIFRGAVHQAAPHVRPKEDLVWVPGPWRDPALLEWQRGGRFELRIFPIPKRASRRVVLTYTEVVPSTAGTRSYQYPLPDLPNLKIPQASFDVQVTGHDDASPPRALGYALDSSAVGVATTAFRKKLQDFSPHGDLRVEYSLADRQASVSAWGFVADAAQVDPKHLGESKLAAFSIRPKLPAPKAFRARDHVLVVDTSRGMFGDKRDRARKLTRLMMEDLDRRDRVTVLACDVRCRPLRAGFVAPGPEGAEDVSAFLSDSTADGANNITQAVRSALSVPGHDPSRDLRITYLVGTTATLGYREPSHLGEAVRHAIQASGASHAQVNVVALSRDVDANALQEVARAGGGVVFDYDAGRSLGDTAHEAVLGAYGSNLRDVSVTLPSGIVQTAPATIAPIRRGGELVMVGQLERDQVEGDVVVRGSLDGEPFETKVPLRLKAEPGDKHAFVQRLYAGLQVREEEARGNRDEAVRLSRRYLVPSRHTSLLVLESEAMFKAFGIDRAGHAAAWSGEISTDPAMGLTGSLGGGKAEADGDALGASVDREDKSDDLRESAKAPRATSADVSAPRAAPAAPAGRAEGPAAAQAAAPGKLKRDEAEARRAPEPPPRPRGGSWMRRVWVRHATIASGAAPESASLRDRIASAQRAADSAPEDRARLRDWAKLLTLAGDDGQLGAVLERWQQKDPFDAELQRARGALLARQGRTEEAARVLSGALLDARASAAERVATLQALSQLHTQVSGQQEACAYRVTLAELRPLDVGAAAEALRCERAVSAFDGAPFARGHKDLDRLLSASPSSDASLYGDFVMHATWDSDADVDVALLAPDGEVLGRGSRRGVRLRESPGRESLAVTHWKTGTYQVLLTRARGAGPLRGTLRIHAIDGDQVVPFSFDGQSARVARISVQAEETLVPTERRPFPGGGSGWVQGWTQRDVQF